MRRNRRSARPKPDRSWAEDKRTRKEEIKDVTVGLPGRKPDRSWAEDRRATKEEIKM